MDTNLCLSIVTAGVAIIALIQTGIQIKLSNKQHLFDKRVENYLIVKGLLELYRENKVSIEEDKKGGPYLAIDLMFILMTNNTYLENIGSTIFQPLKEPEHKEYLCKMEELKNIATKAKFLFNKNTSIRLEEFIICYQQLLSAIYKYQIILNKMQENSERFKSTIEKAAKDVNEEEYRAKLYTAFDNLKEAYRKIEEYKVEEEIEKQIRL